MDRNRLYKIEIDGLIVGEIWPAQTLSFNVRPGEHEVRVKIDFMSSNRLKINVNSLETIELACRGKGSANALVHTFFKRSAYLDVHQVT
jgi:hypothetical protein